MDEYQYDLNYQYKDTTGRISGGMTSQGSNYSDTGVSQYWYQTLSTTVGYMYFKVPPSVTDWKTSGVLWLQGNGTVIVKTTQDRRKRPGELISHTEKEPKVYTLSNKDVRVIGTNNFGDLGNLVTTIPVFANNADEAIQRYIKTGDTSGALNRDQIDTSSIATKVYVDGKTKPNITISWETTSGEDSDNIHIKILNTPTYGDASQGEELVNSLIAFSNESVSYTWGALENLAYGGDVKNIAILTNNKSSLNNVCTAYVSNDSRFSPSEVTASEDGKNTIQCIEGDGSEDGSDESENDTTDKSDAKDENTVVNTANLLTTTYKLTDLQLQQLGNFLWQDDFITNIKLINNSPIENIVSVKAIPCLFTGTESKNVVCGNVDTGVSGVVITNNYLKKTIGTISVSNWYNNFIDYENTKITLYLPLIGQITDLDPHEVMGYKITLKYCFDVITGDVLAMLFNNRGGKNVQNIIGIYRGNCGIDIPLTSSNRAQVEAGYISDAISGVASIVSKNPLGVANAGMSALTRQNTSHSTGSVSGVTAQGLPKKAYLTIMTQGAESYGKNFKHTFGRVCMRGVSKLSSLKGFTLVDSSIDLSTISCTQTEREELRTILASGFYM